MAKIYGLCGSMTGKLADTVMTVRNGEQIARKYQPMVYNPSTATQVAQRAKMKLMSQLSAVMAPVIAIPRQGAVSARNLFTKVNFKLATYAENSADIPLASVQLTKSAVALPELAATRDGNTITASLYRGDGSINRVVYAVFIKEEDNRLRFLMSQIGNTPGDDNAFSTDINVRTTGAVTILAYGVRDNSEAARAYFGDLTVSAEDSAKVVTTRQLTENDITLTETRGINVPAPESPAVNPSPEDGNRSSKKK